MPKYEKLNSQEKECAEFLGLDPKKITQKESKNITDTLNAQKDNLNQASSSKTEAEVKTKRKISRNKVAMEKKIRFLKDNLNATPKSTKNKVRDDYDTIDIKDYLNPNSPRFCNYCNKCTLCDEINTSYYTLVKVLSFGGGLKK